MYKKNCIPIEIGSIWSSNNYGDFKVINSYIKDFGDKKSAKVFDVEFVLTKTIVKEVQNGAVRNGNIKDVFYPKIHNIGYLGDYKNPSDTPLYKVWERIISRCYNKNDPRYKEYGGSGVVVSKEWHCFDNFIKDISLKENYNNLLKEGGSIWQIDKDILCEKKNIKPHIYSNETVIITTISNNAIESNKRMNKFTLENMRGVYYKERVNNKGKKYYYFSVTYSNKDKLQKSLNKNISINKLGYDEAKRQAINLRLQWEKEYGGAN